MRAQSMRTLYICRRPSEKRAVVHLYKSPFLRLVRRESKLDTGCPSVHGVKRPFGVGFPTTMIIQQQINREKTRATPYRLKEMDFYELKIY